MSESDAQGNDISNSRVIPTFPLTRDEVKLLVHELNHHWFSRDHPQYHYADGLMDRMRRFLEKFKE